VQLVHCAAAEIAENGYAATSLARIARRAGVSRGVIAYHFTDKDDLIDQFVAGFYADAAAFIIPRMADQRGARAQIAAFIEANLRFLAEHTSRGPRHLAPITQAARIVDILADSATARRP
jgi:TetR/AcrR family transcriptional regulator, fatty acid metabolism regulator protein